MIMRRVRPTQPPEDLLVVALTAMAGLVCAAGALILLL